MAWEQADFDAAYQRWDNATRAYVPSYRRAHLGTTVEIWQQMIQDYGGLPNNVTNPATYVLVVGCGFGWSMEAIIDQTGTSRIVGTDTSLFIQSDKATEARADIAPLILNIDVTASDARQQFRTAGAGQQGRFDAIITELTVDSIAPAELDVFLDSLEALLRPNGIIAHLVVPAPPAEPDPALGLRELDWTSWIAIRPAHHWIDHTEHILGGGI